jgi:diadenosine tetraphosphate (Ap4A) HIT family hydrolase
VTVALDPRLAADTLSVGRLPLCQVRLMNDAHYPWLILVPERAAARELFDLDDADREQLMREVTGVAGVLCRLCGADKMNVAALGNVVAQLHVHVIARFVSDPAWPAPVWGKLPAAPYGDDAAAGLVERLASALAAAGLGFDRGGRCA